MKKWFLAIITACLVLTSCVKDVAKDLTTNALSVVDIVVPVQHVKDMAKSAKYKLDGDCAKLCDEDWWRKATLADVKAQLNAGAAINGRTDDFETPLHFAAYLGDPQDIKFLVESGADIEAKVDTGETPLQFLCEGTFGGVFCEPERIELFLALGADVNAPSSCTNPDFWGWGESTACGRTLLHTILKNNIEVRSRFALPILHSGCSNWRCRDAKKLDKKTSKSLNIAINAGADVNAMTECGYTPLHHAAETTPEHVMILLKAGADPKTKLKYKPSYCRKIQTPLALATISGNLKGTKAYSALSDATYK